MSRRNLSGGRRRERALCHGDTVVRFSALALTAALLFPHAAQAQESAALPASAEAQAPDGGIRDIIVTARRKAERIQDIPASVSAVNAEGLARVGKLSDIQSLVSGVTFKTQGPQILVGIRGYGNRPPVSGPNNTVGIFRDGISLDTSLITMAARMDVERVEIAKGPQSTLYGRSSFTGAINIVSADPTREFSGYIDAGYGASSVRGDDLWHARAMISGPITDTLSARAYVLREKRDGYTSDRVTGNRGSGWNRKIGQLTLLWEPTDSVRARVSGAVIRDNVGRGDVPAGVILAPLGQRVIFSNPALNLTTVYGSNVWQATNPFPVIGKIRGELATADIRFQTAIGELASLSSYQSSNTVVRNNSNTSRVASVRGGTWTDSKQYTQELRLSGKIDRLSYLFGAYYLHSRAKFQKPGPNFTDYPQATYFPGTSIYDSLGRTMQFQPGYTDTDSRAVFAQVGYDLTEKLNLTVGIRQSHEKLDGTTSQYFRLTSGALLTTVPEVYRKAKFNATTGSASLSYKVVPDVLAYASFSRGDAPGGLNIGAAARVPFAPQKIDAYEVGIKSQLFDRRLKLNIALFDNEYKDLQLVQTLVINGAVANLTTNAGSSYGRGLDVDALAVLSPNWRAGLQYTYARSKITRYRVAPPPAPQVDFTGIPLVRSPRHSLSGSLTFSADIGDGKLQLTAEETYSSSYINDYSGVAAGTAYPGRVGVPAGVTATQVLALGRSPGYALTNLNASYSFGNWELSGYVRNLFNKQYIESAVIVDAISTPLETPGEPRTFELTVKYKF